MTQKLADYVAQFIADQGVQHVFMVPGGGAMHLNHAIGGQTGLHVVSNHHEQASAIAAEAYARVTNNLGVALFTTGPGGTNAITGVAGAWLDSTPCLFLSGQVKRSDIAGKPGPRQLGVQEIDIVSLVASITKYAVTILDPSSIRYHLEKAVYLARSGRPGPVWLDIPLDVQAAMVDSDLLPGFFTSRETDPPVDTPDLEEKLAGVIKFFNQSERPVILVGNGVRLSGAVLDFLQLVEHLGTPVLTTRLGIDLIPSDHPLCMGMPGSLAPRSANFSLQNSDFMLAIGARLDFSLIAYAPDKLARAAKKIMVNIDATEMTKLRDTLDIGIEVDAGVFIRGVLDRTPTIVQRDRSAWVQRCLEWKEKYPFVMPEHRAGTEKVSVYYFAEVLSEELGGDCVVLPGNAGNASELFLTAFRAKVGQRIFHNKGTGAMGFSQPAAIGACLASGGKPTICVDGDGGFQMNIQELETVRRLGLPIKFFIMNNGGYASIRASQQNYFGRLTGADSTSGMTLPDVVQVGCAYGLPSFRIAEPCDLRAGILKVLATPGPVICDVQVIPDELRAPRVASMQRPDGSMVSKPLEDMAPFLSRDEFLSNMIVTPLKDA